MTSPEVANVLKKYVTSKPIRFGGPLSGNKQTRQNRKDFEELQALALKDMGAFNKKLNDMKAKQGDSHSAVRDVLAKAGLSRHITDENKIEGDETMNESYKDKFNAAMKKFGINSLDDLKTDADKKKFFKHVDSTHTADHEEVELDEFARHLTGETVARLMKDYPRMKPFVGKVLRLRTVTRVDLEKILPDYIPGSDITKLLTVKGKYRGEEVKEEFITEYPAPTKGSVIAKRVKGKVTKGKVIKLDKAGGKPAYWVDWEGTVASTLVKLKDLRGGGLHQRGVDYVVHESFNEGTWHISKSLQPLRTIMTLPMPYHKKGFDFVAKHIGDDELWDDLGDLKKGQDMRPAIKKAMKRLGIKEEVQEGGPGSGPQKGGKKFSDKQIKQAYGILNDPRYKQGNYSGASKAIDKLAKGLSDHPDVKNALKRANESKENEMKQESSKYHDTKPGSIQDTIAQMQADETKGVTIKVKEFSELIETYLNKGGVSHNLSPVIAEKELSGVLPLQAVREFIGTYNRHFLTNFKAEEFIVSDGLNEMIDPGLDRNIRNRFTQIINSAEALGKVLKNSTGMSKKLNQEIGGGAGKDWVKMQKSVNQIIDMLEDHEQNWIMHADMSEG